MAEKGPLDWLVEINDSLEQIPGTILTYFDALEAFGENLTQAYVDIWCRYMAWVVNINIERLRQRVLRSLSEQNTVISKIIGFMNLAKEVISDPIGVVGSFFSTITAPIKTAYEFITTLVTELARLAKNLARITEVLPPAPPNPHINFNEFKLQIGTASMTSLGGVDALPPPEVMFPEPAEKPMGREAFMASFNSGQNAFNEEKETKEKYYTPKKAEKKEEDKKES